MRENSKLQTPNSREIPNFKLQGAASQRALFHSRLLDPWSIKRRARKPLLRTNVAKRLECAVFRRFRRGWGEGTKKRRNTAHSRRFARFGTVLHLDVLLFLCWGGAGSRGWRRSIFRSRAGRFRRVRRCGNGIKRRPRLRAT